MSLTFRKTAVTLLLTALVAVPLAAGREGCDENPYLIAVGETTIARGCFNIDHLGKFVDRLKPPVIWFERDGKEYEIRDAPTVAKAAAFYEQQRSAKMRRKAMRTQQRELRQRERQLERLERELDREDERLDRIDAGAAEREKLEKRERELEAQERVLEQEADRIEAIEERLEREEEEHEMRAEKKLEQLILEALRDGRAKRR